MYRLGTPEFCSNHIRLSTDFFFVSVMKRVISQSILYFQTTIYACSRTIASLVTDYFK